jgi:hypothetical protein
LLRRKKRVRDEKEKENAICTKAAALKSTKFRTPKLLLNGKAVGLSLGTNVHYGLPDSALDLAFSSMFSSWRA